ncbi:hypothetical protein K6K41_22740 [Chenggangzhangella methanolivorans]|uniref:Esterase n=2 Tax=Chenggangzhangella methanolivorans TaxID=1437009 RepID=A0A9E6RJ93_9HYPH|nr:hypothetical protein K6K41_22740 [Chenggangzhangella methanolivorans]
MSSPTPALDHPLVFSVYRPALAPTDGTRWPVVYLLEGRPGLSDWIDQGSVYEVIDRAIAEGAIPPTLVVMAAAPFSWYADNPQGQGLVATALTRDLVAAVDARYPTAACREGRAIGGLSMGGYGAVLYGLTRADLYVGAMSFAGAIAPPIGADETERLARSDVFYDGAFGRPLDRARFNDMTLFAKLREASRAHGPKAALFLAAGDADRGGLLLSTTRLHVEAKRAGFDSTLRIGAGLHDWPTWRNQLAEGLAWLGPRLDPSCGKEIARAAPLPGGGEPPSHGTP